MASESPGSQDEAESIAKRGRLGRLRRALGFVAASLGLTTIFVSASAAALLLHLNLAPFRHIARDLTNRVLGSLFEGKIVVDEIDRLSLGSVDVRSAVVLDGRGDQVIRASGIRASIDLKRLLSDLLFTSDELHIILPQIRVENADVLVERRNDGRLGIESAFALRPSVAKKPSDAKAGKTTARKGDIALEHIEIGHAWVHGLVAPPTALDGDVSRLVAAIRVNQQGFLLDVEPTGIRERAILPTPVTGSGDYHFYVLLPPEAVASAGQEPGSSSVTKEEPTFRMWSGFSGRAGSIEVLARAGFENNRAWATLELPRAEADDLKLLLPELPIENRVSARFSFDGEAPTFDVDASIELSSEAAHPGKVEAHGKLDVRDGGKLVLDVTTTDFNLNGLRADLPDVELDATARLLLAASPTPRLVAEATTQPTMLLEQPLPAADIHLALDHNMIEGRVTLHEPGMPTTGGFVAPITGKEITFQVDTFVPALEAAPRIAGPATGSARVRVRGGLAQGNLDARIEGAVQALHVKGGASLEDGRVSGRVHGPLDKLELEASLDGEGVRGLGHGVDKITAHARGPIKIPTIDVKLVGGDVDTLEASGRLDPENRRVDNVTLHLERRGERVDGKAGRIGFGAFGAQVDGLALSGTGLGTVEGALVTDGNELSGKLSARGLDMAKLGKLLDLDRRTQGLADVDISLRRTPRGRKGHVRVLVEDATLSAGGLPITGVSTQIAATFTDDRATLDGVVRLVDRPRKTEGASAADACSGVIAEVRVSGGNGSLRGPLLRVSTWEKLTGSANVEAKDWDLRCLAKRLPLALVLGEVGGKLSTTFSVDRPQGQRFASVRALELQTSGLTLTGPTPFGQDKPKWDSRFVDVAVKGDLNGATGDTKATITLLDGSEIAALSGQLALDLATLFDDPKRRLASLRATDMTLEAIVPRRSIRSFQSLPSFLRDRLPPIEGDVALDVSASGTPDNPTLRAKVRGFGVYPSSTGSETNPFAIPLDIEANAAYDNKRAFLGAYIRKDNHAFLVVTGRADGDISPWSPVPYDPRFELQAILTQLSLSDIPYLAERDVNGSASGKLTFRKLGDEPDANVSLEVSGLNIGGEANFDRATFSLDIAHPKEAKSARGVVQIELSQPNKGRIDATGYAGVTWRGLVPTTDDTAPADFFMRAHAFDLSIVHPLVADIFSRVGGALDGDLRVGFRRFGDDNGGRLEAKMELREGVFHVPQMGQEFRHARVSIHTEPGGELRFDDIHAEGISGAVRGWLSTKLDGLAFRTAEGELQIDRGDEMPVTFEGVPVGRAYGKLNVRADKQGRQVNMTVSVPALHIALPESSGRAVQSLDPNPEISVSHVLGPPKESRSKDALTYAITLNLGEIEVEGTDVSMKLASVDATPPRILLTDEARLSGEIRLTSGLFNIIGKKFELERGLVRLRQEESGNPYVNLTARWDAPDGTRVFVDYVGVLKPITESKLHFRSSPPLSQQSILSMILIGDTPEAHKGSSSAPTPSAADIAAGVVGGEIASAQLNAILSQIAPLRGLSTRVGTTESGRLRTSVIYELGDTVTAQATYEGSPTGDRLSGVQTTGGSDQTNVNRAEVNIDWRFSKNWSLRGSFGFGGATQQPNSGLDMLWQYRY